MAIYVDDGGDDTDGSTWAKAYNSIENAGVTGVAAGTTVYIGSDHQETKAAAHYVIDFANGTIANPVILITADITSGEPPSTYETMSDGGGYIQTTGAADDITLTGNIVAYGLKLDCEDVTTLNANQEVQRYVDCYFDSTDHLIVAAGTAAAATFENCTFNVPNDNIVVSGAGEYRFAGCTFSAVDGSGHFVGGGGGDSLPLIVEDCDLSSEQTIFNNLVGNACMVFVRRCELHADTLTLPHSGTIDHPETWIQIESSKSGNNTVPVLGLQRFDGFYGTILRETTEYRTGGASDGETPYSWKMTCNTNTVSRHAALKTPPIVRWLAAGSQTLTVYVAHDAVGDGAGGDLQDDECWLEVSSPDETANPSTTSQGKYQNTLPATPTTAAADLTNEGSDQWQDTPTTYQQITVSVNPAEAGPMTVRVCLATGASSVVFVDPKLYVS
jgi:phosphoribosylformylglycinamidine (FGAM) synthase PurS component